MSGAAAVEAVGLTGDLPGGAADFQQDFFSRERSPTAEIQRTGKPGRPAGALNKTTAQMIEFLQRQYGDPRIALAKVMSSSIDQVHAAVGGKRLEAADFWLRATVALLPYMAGKPAVEIAVKNEKTSLHLFAGVPGAQGALPAGGIVAMLEQAAAQARAEGFDTALGVVIEGEAVEMENPEKTGS